MAKVKFDPTINVGSLLTIGGGLCSLIVAAVTAYVQLGSLRDQQHVMAEKLVIIGDRQGSITASVARIEGRIDVLMERRRADLGNARSASID